MNVTVVGVVAEVFTQVTVVGVIDEVFTHVTDIYVLLISLGTSQLCC